MRRVIIDQIEALAELNRIVARHGRVLENDRTAPRAGAGARPWSAAAAPPRARRRRASPIIAGRNFPSRRRRSGRSVRAAPPRTKRLRSRPRRRPASRAPAGCPICCSAPRATTLPKTICGCEDRPARAEERQARHAIESLDALSVDIARMIDHDAAAELWDRYNRGERNVFTRRLYTLQGQQAFDEIRKRYRADREFKQTVDRYIAEFERLLEDVSRDDRGQVVVRTYLTSETGKVYTMLAHAAGRFD